MTARGGSQRIPRPATALPGRAPPWWGLPPEARHLTLADVRVRCATLPAARRPERLAASGREAAVLVALFEDDAEARVILTKRTETVPWHRGEIAFPGGNVRPGVDASALDAALREAHEEIGLAPESVEVVGELDGVATLASRFVITPFVGVLAARPALVPDPAEVAAVFDLSISALLEDDAWREERWPIGDAERRVAFFELPGETIWGATAAILTVLLAHLTAGR